MKIRYFYQQIGSHLSVLILAFLIISLVFSQFIERMVYENKIDELTSYGNNILRDIENNTTRPQDILNQYTEVLKGREIEFSLFDVNSKIIYSVGDMPVIELTKEEWSQIKSGRTVALKQEFRRFEQGVTFVLLPYVHEQYFSGGILLVSPVKGPREIITSLHQYLFYAVMTALLIAIILSAIVASFHVNRIKKIQAATSTVAAGDYNVRIPSSDFDEIGVLAQDFNKMVEKLKYSMDEIESLENRRRQFMADVSHELRTPLTTINGVIEGLQSDLIPENEKQRGLALAGKESKRLIRLVNENLDYEKIRSNQIKLNIEEIDLQEVLEIIQEQLSGLAAEKDNEIFVVVDEDVSVFADYDRLIQILINITKNSIQFTQNGKIYLRGQILNNETVIEIEDTGIGIDPVEIEKIWDRFYKALLSRTTNPFGEFGLGLSIVKQLVTLHHGRISVESEEGKGTKFMIYLPLEKNK